MTIILPLDPIAAFATEHPWPAVTLVFFLGVVLPAIWSTRSWRRHAAMAVIQIIVDACATVAAIATRDVDATLAARIFPGALRRPRPGPVHSPARCTAAGPV